MKSAPLAAGQVHTAERYPFVREVYTDEEMSSSLTWRPGSIHDMGDPYSGDRFIAHGTGQMELTIVQVVPITGWPTRVFYVRHFIDPDGRRFGKRRLKVTTEGHFRKLARGYRHGFDIVAAPDLKTGNEWQLVDATK